MSVTFGPARSLDGPVPAPPRHSLLAVAKIVPDADLHYLSGGQVWPYPDRRSGDTFDPCATGTSRDKSGQQDLPLPEFGAYTVYETIECTSRSISADFEEWAARARAALEAVESALVEEEFATGVRMPLNPYLTDANVNVLDASGLGPVESLARLERGIAVTGQRGVIHADPATVVAWLSAQVVAREGDQLVSVVSGSPVVSGQGYVGAIPAGQGALGATEGWAFATGPVEVRRTEITTIPGSVVEAMDYMQNDITIRAERDYLVTWDTVLQDAILVDRAA